MTDSAEMAALAIRFARMQAELEELQAKMTTHIGIDWGATGVNYPHPNLNISVAEFGDGRVRLDNTSIQIVPKLDSTTSLYTAVLNRFVTGSEEDVASYIASNFGMVRRVYYFNSGGLITFQDIKEVNIGTAQKVTQTTGCADNVLTSMAKTEIVNNGVTTVVSVESTQVSNPDGYLHVDPAIYLKPRATDPTVVDGELWYRSDTDKFRARANGASVNLLTSGDVPTKEYIDLRLVSVNAAAPAWVSDAHGSLTGNGAHVDFSDGTDYTLLFESVTVPPRYSASMALELAMSGPTGGGNYVLDLNIGEHANGAGGSTDIMSLADQVSANHASANTMKVHSFNVENAPTVSAVARQLQVTVVWNGAHASNTEDAHFWGARLAYTPSI